MREKTQIISQLNRKVKPISERKKIGSSEFSLSATIYFRTTNQKMISF